jgi:hypothetical protein
MSSPCRIQDKVIARLAAGPAVAFAKTKDAINAATLTELEPALAREFNGQSGLLRANDLNEGTKAFQEKRAPSSPIPEARQTPNNGGSASTMIRPHTKWVSIGASTPPLARRSNAHTVPRMIAATPSIGFPLAIVAAVYKMVEMATGRRRPSAV